MKEEAPRIWRKIHFIVFAVVLVAGVILGSVIFPTVKEVPVVRIVEKRVEVPVVRIVEKRVEVPVDRVVEKRIEVPVDRVVEKRIEVPTNKAIIKYVSDRTLEVNGKPSYVISEERIKLWGQINIGMTRQQVVGILGPPDFKPSVYQEGTVSFAWGQGMVYFNQISKGGLVLRIRPPEY